MCLLQESETNLVELGSRAAKNPRVKFNEECMFLAACAAGDKDEVSIQMKKKFYLLEHSSFDYTDILYNSFLIPHITEYRFDYQVANYISYSVVYK